jgi:hypothetical protein
MRGPEWLLKNADEGSTNNKQQEVPLNNNTRIENTTRRAIISALKSSLMSIKGFTLSSQGVHRQVAKE